MNLPVNPGSLKSVFGFQRTFRSDDPDFVSAARTKIAEILKMPKPEKPNMFTEVMLLSVISTTNNLLMRIDQAEHEMGFRKSHQKKSESTSVSASPSAHNQPGKTTTEFL
jgi:hypothetical protein